MASGNIATACRAYHMLTWDSGRTTESTKGGRGKKLSNFTIDVRDQGSLGRYRPMSDIRFLLGPWDVGRPTPRARTPLPFSNVDYRSSLSKVCSSLYFPRIYPQPRLFSSFHTGPIGHFELVSTLRRDITSCYTMRGHAITIHRGAFKVKEVIITLDSDSGA